MQNKISDILIIGGGAAGLMAGIGAAKVNAGAKITVLEKMPRPGRKIIITGKGRCNLSNFKDWEDFSTHIHPKPNFLKNAFFNFSPEKTVGFFEEHGLRTVTERGDRVFPESGNSKDVVDTLVSAAGSLGVDIITGTEIRHIGTNPDGTFSADSADGTKFNGKSLIVTTGGLSYPATGSTGDGLEWASELGLGTVPCFPSLTAIVPKGYKATKDGISASGHIHRETPLSETGALLNGNRLKNISLRILIDGTEVYDEFGDIDFTDGGLEGPLGFKVSRKCVKAIINGSKVKAIIDMKPAVTLNELDKRISALWKEINEDRRSRSRSREDRMRILLGKLLPSDLIRGFLKYRPVNEAAKVGKVLKNWEMDIAGYVGYERCVITAGGISTDEVSAKTMECKKIPGLYFAGEILDLDADTGGYNLQTAFSTGRLAGESAARKISTLQ